MSLTQHALTHVDWQALPQPVDDGGAAHLDGLALPSVPLPATDGRHVDLSSLPGLAVVYLYPMTGRPDRPLPDGWDATPGARGCTPQSCAYRDHAADLAARGVAHLFGLSTQSTDWQAEAAGRLHLPYALLSDADLRLARALNLPTFQADGMTLLKRCTLILRDGVIVRVHYPVFPPDQDAARVIAWLDDPVTA
ncbi:Peroxiredoxin [Loktanella fryxellensis]|uniref:Peroxiredoxin n=1 Tax=Loktanella fryxellensis TaxID=245187 RepID=A0A1H8FHQ7_9RHOB|nr:peroxiredoxin [Loktanella fryxellensis]SEN30608.1 Peroxiredoxin [Loktanella fryxellensis]